jgi:hypothetical protein
VSEEAKQEKPEAEAPAPFDPIGVGQRLAELRQQQTVAEAKLYEAQAHVKHWEYQHLVLQTQITALQAEVRQYLLPQEAAKLAQNMQAPSEA